jgi:hypothetical protein
MRTVRTTDVLIRPSDQGDDFGESFPVTVLVSLHSLSIGNNGFRRCFDCAHFVGTLAAKCEHENDET